MMSVHTSDGRAIQVPIPEGAQPGTEVDVQVPATVLLGHFQVVRPLLLRRFAALDSKKCGSLKPGDEIALFERRSVRRGGSNGSSENVNRGRCEQGWLSLQDSDGDDVVVQIREKDVEAQRDASRRQHISDHEDFATDECTCPANDCNRSRDCDNFILL